jgi:hypothetical protein
MLSSILTPVLALVVWTLVVLVWLYVRRIPAMRAAKIDIGKIKGKETHGMLQGIPVNVHWVADNYNHLHEQPTLFYALCVYSHLTGLADPINVGLAWGYVALRVIHSVIQATYNYVPHRFLAFVLSSAVLGAIAVRNVLHLFGLQG